MSQRNGRFAIRLVAAAMLALAVLAVDAKLQAQVAVALSQVKKIYIEPFTGKRGAAEIRAEVIDRLKRDPALALVATAPEADAVLRGHGEIWTTGYIGTNPRAQSSRNPVYSGYLSLTLQGRDGQPLWSYLVTPAGSLSSSITSNIAGRAAKLLAIAVAGEKGNDLGAIQTASAPASHPASAGETLKGAGATFPAPLYQAWIESFQQLHPEARITYQPVGSEEGMRRLRNGQIDFAGSDIAAPSAETSWQRFATVLGGVVPIYNLRGLSGQLRFTPEILAGIYLGKIDRWNAPEIRAVNRGLNLPASSIMVVHRSDGSGTTSAFTDFLTKTSPAWKAAVGVGSSVSWPIGTGAAGNDGIASLVESTPDSIGYVELSYAIQHEIGYGAVRNETGAFITANLESLAAAAQSAGTRPEATLSIVNAPGRAAYPIACFSWIVLAEPVADEKRKNIGEMLQWMLTSGQKQSSGLGYAPLPRDLANRELEALAKLK